MIYIITSELGEYLDAATTRELAVLSITASHEDARSTRLIEEEDGVWLVKVVTAGLRTVTYNILEVEPRTEVTPL